MRDMRVPVITSMTPYSEILRRGAVASCGSTPATEDGTLEGTCQSCSVETSSTKKRRDQGPYTFAGAGQLLNPVADEAQGFKSDWIQYYTQRDDNGRSFNKYILVDPANEKKKSLRLYQSR